MRRDVFDTHARRTDLPLCCGRTRVSLSFKFSLLYEYKSGLQKKEHYSGFQTLLLSNCLKINILKELILPTSEQED